MFVRQQQETRIFSDVSITSSNVFSYAFILSGCKDDSPALSCLVVAFLQSDSSQELIR